LARQQRGDNRAGQASKQQLLRTQAVRKIMGRDDEPTATSCAGSAFNPRRIDGNWRLDGRPGGKAMRRNQIYLSILRLLPRRLGQPPAAVSGGVMSMIHVWGSVQRGGLGWSGVGYLGGEGLAGVPAVGRGGAGAVLIPAVLGRARDARQHLEALRRLPMADGSSRSADGGMEQCGCTYAKANSSAKQASKRYFNQIFRTQDQI
jgi:hypothetical protein